MVRNYILEHTPDDCDTLRPLLIMQVKEPEWISAEPRNHIVFEALLSFVDKTRAEPSQVDQLATETMATLQSTATQDPPVEQYRYESRVFFAILLSLLQQIDAAAPEQDYLVALVVQLRDVPIPTSVLEEIDERAIDIDMNYELNHLKHVWANFEHDAPLHPRLDDRRDFVDNAPIRPPWRQERGHYMTARSWGNISAFLARLHTAAPDVIKLDLRGLYAMIEALEEPRSPIQLEDVLPTAAYWIIYAGNELRNNNVPYAYNPVDHGTKRLPWSKGSLWNGQHAFSEERWGFWMQRFQDISERTDVDEEVKRIARGALEAGSRTIRTV